MTNNLDKLLHTLKQHDIKVKARTINGKPSHVELNIYFTYHQDMRPEIITFDVKNNTFHYLKKYTDKCYGQSSFVASITPNVKEIPASESSIPEHILRHISRQVEYNHEQTFIPERDKYLNLINKETNNEKV